MPSAVSRNKLGHKQTDEEETCHNFSLLASNRSSTPSAPPSPNCPSLLLLSQSRIALVWFGQLLLCLCYYWPSSPPGPTEACGWVQQPPCSGDCPLAQRLAVPPPPRTSRSWRNSGCYMEERWKMGGAGKQGLGWLASLASRQTFKSVKYLASFAVLGKGERLEEEGGERRGNWGKFDWWEIILM